MVHFNLKSVGSLTVSIKTLPKSVIPLQWKQVHLLMQRHKRKALATVLCEDKGL